MAEELTKSKRFEYRASTIVVQREGAAPLAAAAMLQAKRRPGSTGVGAPPPMGVGSFAGGFAPSKLASLAWPPPPSPAHVNSSGACKAGLGATSPAGAAFGGLDAKEEHRGASGLRAAEARARAELWALRGEIEREKLRAVPPHPFFGQAMRFQDEFSALQIADDGRFSYSTVSFEAPDADERCAPEAGRAERRVTSYEGVFAPLATDDGSGHAAGGEGGAAGGGEDAGARCDAEVATIEGRALACHVVVEEASGRTRLESVQPGVFRFSIAVSPFYRPRGAMVQPMAQPRSPDRPAPRRRQLPYVGTGEPRQRSGLSPAASAAKLNVAAGAELLQTRRLGPRRKFSCSAASLRQAPSSPTMSPTGAPRRSIGRLSSCSASASAPQLPSLASPPAAPAAPPSAGKDQAKMSAAEWKEFYRERARQMLAEQC